MPQLKHNDISNDTIETRLYRLLRMQNNIDTHAAELGVAGPLLTWAQGSHTRFSDAVTAATVEAGESKDASIIVRDKFAATQDYYQKAKEILAALLAGYKPDEILLASYGINKPTPRTYLALTEAIDAFEATHDRLVAAGDERVIAQAIIDNMVALGNDFEAEVDKAGIEDREKDVAYQEQHSIYNEDTEKLRLVFKIACMIWGDDDPKLKDLGFVPSSEIWTPGNGGVSPDIGIPQNILAEIIGEDVKISWDEVEDVDSYQLGHTEHLPLFIELYAGADTEYLHINPIGGTHYYNVRAKKGNSYGEHSEVASVEVEGVVPDPPTGLELEYEAAENRLKGTFQAPANSPDGFNVFVAMVPIGNSPPDKPVEAYYEDLFTLSFFISPLQIGMTYYVWVTSVDDGEESEPCGPEAIDIV